MQAWHEHAGVRRRNSRREDGLFPGPQTQASKHPVDMRTFWIADPTPSSRKPARLEWGSSEWAADSCLAAWSEFEREWIGAPAPKRDADSKPPAPSAPPPPLLVACFVVLALGLSAFAWSVVRTLFG